MHEPKSMSGSVTNQEASSARFPARLRRASAGAGRWLWRLLLWIGAVLRRVARWICIPWVTGSLLLLVTAGATGLGAYHVVRPYWGETRLVRQAPVRSAVFEAKVDSPPPVVTGQPGEQVQVRWVVRNMGDAHWAPDLVWAVPEEEWLPVLTLHRPAYVGTYVDAGEDAVFAGQFDLPDRPGTHLAVWRLHSPAGPVSGGLLEAYLQVIRP